MKVCCYCKVEKPGDMFSPDKRASDGLQSRCRACVSAVLRDRYAADPDAGRAKRKDYYARKPEIVLAVNARSRAKHPEQIAAGKKADYEAKKNLPEFKAARQAYSEENKVVKQAYDRQYRDENRAHCNEYSAAKKARRRNATPAWANKFFIQEIYDLAQRRTKATGFEWHVDHIVPLKHPLVQGLHVEFNLRVIPGKYNIIKGNRVWPDMPGEKHG